jgi:hypothetical protein
MSPVPPKQDGSKAPLSCWKKYQTKAPSEQQLCDWYKPWRTGIGLVLGKVTPGLEFQEFDDRPTYDAYKALANAAGLGELVERIEAGYCEESPSGGIHWPYRCSETNGNQKLAKRPATPEELAAKPDDRYRTLIETRGEGGYIVIAPSSGAVHPTSKPYRLLSGSLTTIATITPEERADLHALAHTFDQVQKTERRPSIQPTQTATTGDRPGDDFGRQTEWADILEPHGWQFVYERDGEQYWCRPGKSRATSATTNYKGSGLFYPFTSSTDFDPNKSYNKFAAYAFLNHNGDFTEAARTLASKGYGRQTEAIPATEPKKLFRSDDATPDARVRIAELETLVDSLRAIIARQAAELLPLRQQVKELLDLQRKPDKRERDSILALHAEYESAKSRGQLDEDGFARANLGVVAPNAGFSRPTVAAHGRLFEKQTKLLELRSNPHGLSVIDRETGEIRTLPALFVKFNGDASAIRRAISDWEPERPPRGRPRGRACPDHPGADLILRKTWTCSVCHAEVDAEETTEKAFSVDDPGQSHEAETTPDVPPGDLDRVPMVRSGTIPLEPETRNPESEASDIASCDIAPCDICGAPAKHRGRNGLRVCDAHRLAGIGKPRRANGGTEPDDWPPPPTMEDFWREHGSAAGGGS